MKAQVRKRVASRLKPRRRNARRKIRYRELRSGHPRYNVADMRLRGHLAPGVMRKRCRFCRKLFLTKYETAKYCPGSDHKILRWQQLHPRVNASRAQT